MAKMRKSERDHSMAKYGTDKQFLEWLSYQPSCLTGYFNQYIDGVGRNIACHVRRASNSGTAVKPPYSAVPMTAQEHDYQHKHGEKGVIFKYLGQHVCREAAKKWFDNEVAIHLIRWSKR